MTRLLLGVDGGGTKTEAVIVDEHGRFRGQGFGGASNFNNTGLLPAQDSIQTAVAQAAAAAAVPPTNFDAAFLGIAGVVSPADRASVLQMATALDLASEPFVGADHDCRIALAGGLGGAPGVVQILGTGASCFGLNAAGRRWLAAGWGRLLGDEGSGYWLGLQAMKAATAAYDGRGRQTILLDMVLNALNLDVMEQIMQRVYGSQMSVTDIAALGKLVVTAAQRSDPVAVEIINTGVEAVALGVAAVADRLALTADALRLVCVGGLTQAGDVIMTPLATAVHHHLPDCRIESPQFSACVGAALLAARRMQGEIPTSFLANLSETLHH